MKKTVIILPLLLVVFIIGFIPVTTSVGVRVNATYFNLFQQLEVAHNWIKWQPELKRLASKGALKVDSSKTGFQIKGGDVVFNVKYDNSNNFSIHEVKNNKEFNYKYAIGPDSSANSAIVLVSFKTNLLGYWRAKYNGRGINQTAILHLKAFMESTKLYYGFSIERKQTTGKLILVKNEVVCKNNQFTEINKIVKELNDLVVKHQLQVVNAVQMQNTALAADSVRVMVGLPVNKKATVQGNVVYMNMPPGKILVGTFSGKYKDKQKIYDAMQSYIQDNYLHPLIQPYERFPDNKLPVSDNEIINMQVVIPYI